MLDPSNKRPPPIDESHLQRQPAEPEAHLTLLPNEPTPQPGVSASEVDILGDRPNDKELPQVHNRCQLSMRVIN